MKFSSASMLLRQRSNCTGISSQEARVAQRSWVRCWSRCGRQGSSSIPCHIGGTMNSDGANNKRKRQRQTTSSLAGRQLLPVIVEILAGSIFPALMHAGYGIWSLDEMLIRPVPSMDDMVRTSISDLLISYQAHVAKHLTSISTIAYNSHFYSHRLHR